MTPITLTRPMVGELVAALLTLDQSRPIIINDADTGWAISIIHIDGDSEGVRIVLSGDYNEMEISP